MSVSLANQASSPGFLSGGGEMGALMRAKDWSQTPLGPIETWSPALRMMASFLLANRFPLLLWWGPQYLSLYNDAYRPILGNKHPDYLGRPVQECWAEIWHVLKPLIDQPFNGGPATWMEDILLEVNRYGFVEETHFTVAYSPVPDETAPRGIGGVLATVHEITDKVIGERRLQALRDLGLRVTEGRTGEAACAIAAETLVNCARDVPFALLYLLDENHQQARLASVAGLAMDEPASPRVIDLADDAYGKVGWPLAEAVRSEAMVTVSDLHERFGEHVPRGPWPVPPQRAVVVPIRSHKAHQLSGLLVVGVSALLQLDEPYRSFFDLVAAQIATAIANARAYEEERKRAQALAEIDRAKTAFFSNVSHEFRTPLTLLLGPLEDVLNEHSRDALSFAQRAQLEVAHRNSIRLLRLVNALLDFSRIEARRSEASYQLTDLAALTADLASGFRSATDRAGLFLDIDCPPLPELVMVDREMWETVILNLLSNAFKFSFEGGISVALRADGNNAVLSVRDTGVGIPSQELPHLFERFHRIEGQPSRSFEGSGIGLALVHELLQLHSGAITVRSVLGQGSEFIVSIPFGTAHLPDDCTLVTTAKDLRPTRIGAFVEEALRWLPEGAQGGNHQPVLPDQPKAEDVSRAIVLLAEDNADMRAYVSKLLADHYEVEAVPDGQVALEAIRRRRPDLVLTDVMMPRLDGFGLMRAIRDDPFLRDIPVVMLSARAGEEASVDGLDSGADDYLTKPFSARELRARVDANLGLARMRRAATEALRVRTAELETVLETVPVAVWFTHEPHARQVFGNQAAAHLLRLSHGNSDCLSAPGLECAVHAQVFREGVQLAQNELALYRAARGEVVHEEEVEVRFDEGASITLLLNALPVRDEKGSVTGAICAAIDVTERKRIEEQTQEWNKRLEARVAEEVAAREKAQAGLAQAQRMEALGQLAGGIAHDFNNVIQVVQGAAGLIESRPGDAGRAVSLAHRIIEASDRGAAITRRLLAFSRRGDLRAEPVEVTALLAGTQEILCHTLGTGVTVEVETAPSLPLLFVDKRQLETVLVNLATNARDAMQGMGTLRFHAEMEVVEDNRTASAPISLRPGLYVRLSATDSGPGMTPEVLARASEPFFTTKSSGKGTGLGLAMARGFAEQSGGGMAIESTPGYGTVVKLWLPATEGRTSIDVADEDKARAAAFEKMRIRLLLVDDDDLVRETLTQELEGEGYAVLPAASGAEALSQLDAGEEVALVISDLSMPEMDGVSVIREVHQRYPSLPAILLTGFATSATGIELDSPASGALAVLRKPMRGTILAERVAMLLEGAAAAERRRH
jgi:signal transduction histidine kinase/DNA-binding response OmpR family regulator